MNEEPNVYLRAFEVSDLELLNSWHNDQDINSLTTGRKYFVSTEYDRKWIEERMLDNYNYVYCAICEYGSSKMVGYTNLTKIDYINRKAFWGGLIIGDENSKSKGYATSAAIQILKYGFCELGLNRIWADWLDDHTVAQFTTGKMLGFVQEGVSRQAVYKDNSYHDVIVMSLLKSEFEKKHL